MQVKKKAAKKTYKSSAKKKTVPSLKKMSVEELLAVMTENHAKTEAAIQKLSADLAESHVRMEARHAKTETAIQELSAENRLLAAEIKKTSAAVRELTRNMGGLNNSFGTLVEVVLIPKIRHDINALGNHSFKEIITKPESCRTW